MAKRKFHEKVETWIIVTVISVLVWLYAEATVLKENSKFIQVRFTEPTDSYAVSPRGDQSVRVSFKASSGQWEQFEKLTGQPLIIPVDADPGEDQQTKPAQIAEKLMATELGELGITDLQTEPAVIVVELQAIKEMTLPVTINPGPALLENYTIDPPSITVKAPADIVEQYKDAQVVAALSAADVAGKEPGQQAIAPHVELLFPDGLDPDGPLITAVVRDVRINFTLDDSDQSTVKPRLPIFINMPVEQQSRYDVILKRQFMSDVKLTGPAEVIAGIESDDPRYAVWAEIQLNNLSQLSQEIVVFPKIRGGPAVVGISTDHPDTEGISATIRLRNDAAQ